MFSVFSFFGRFDTNGSMILILPCDDFCDAAEENRNWGFYVLVVGLGTFLKERYEFHMYIVHVTISMVQIFFFSCK